MSKQSHVVLTVKEQDAEIIAEALYCLRDKLHYALNEAKSKKLSIETPVMMLSWLPYIGSNWRTVSECEKRLNEVRNLIGDLNCINPYNKRDER